MLSAPAGSARPGLKKALKIALGLAIVVGVGIQFVPVKDVGVNPPARFTLDAPADVQAILVNSCYDCHSNETRWPFYARLAPGSWLMARDVRKGRSQMNFSEWGDTDEGEREIDKENAWDQIESGAMPKWFYTAMPNHWSARLSADDKAKLKAWLLRDKKAKGDKPEKKEASAPAK
jgi:hypothetical protein